MNSPRPPPRVLFIHNGSPAEAHKKHLIDAGLRVSEVHAESAVAEAARIQPDIIVLDFECDGEMTRELKAHADTQHIPVIALVTLLNKL